MLSSRYLNRLPNELVELFSELEIEIIADISKKLHRANYGITDAMEWQMCKLNQLGYTQKEINKLIAKYLNKSTRTINKIMSEATLQSYNNETFIYKRAKKENATLGALVDFKEAPHLQQLLDAGIKQTAWELQNFTRTIGATASTNYIKALDLAWLQVQSGAFTTQQAVKKAVIRLADEGIRTVDYASGRTERLDVAVRRAVVTGSNKTVAEISIKRMQDMGTDLVITTSHVGSRPSHAEWQGKVFSYSGTSKKYPPFRERTGYGTGAGLCGWNCRHNFFPYFEGISSNYNDIISKRENNETYEAEQKQRYIERTIRAWKRRERALSEIGEDTTRERMKIREWQFRQREHISKNNLSRQYNREAIY